MNEPRTVDLSESAGVLTISLNRPERLNAFDQEMCDDLAAVWDRARVDDDVRAVVLQANGDRAFCVGADQKDKVTRLDNPWSRTDPGTQLGPKARQVWKPVVCALHGMVAGGAFYFVNESDIVICSEGTTFFDPHVSYGKTASLEPIGARWRMPLGEVLRMSLLGLDERMSAQRALQVGLVSEIVPVQDLRARAQDLARRIAAKPPAAVQGTVRAIWDSLDRGRTAALAGGLMYTQIGNPLGAQQAPAFGTADKTWELR